MADTTSFTKGSRVEVSSDDVGFKDAWYVATVVDIIQPSSTKKRSNNKNININTNKAGYLVKYETLFQEHDVSLPLTEIVDPLFVRPLPPCNEDNNGNEGDAIELYDVVDAYHLDGWWCGVVTKVIGGGEMRKYTVSFQSPPEEFVFERSALRLHVDWVDCQWRVPLKKKTYSRNKDITDSVEEPPRAKRFQSSRGKKGNTEGMEFARGSSGSQAKHQDSLLLVQETNITIPEHVLGLLAYRKTTQTPSKGALTNSAKKKSHSQKKPKTYGRNKDITDSVEKTPRAKRFQPSRGKKGNTKDMESARGSSESQAKHQDSLLLEQETNITESGEAEDGNNQQKRKRGRPPKTPVKTPNGLLQDNEETREIDSSAIEETPSELDEQPLSMWYQGLHPLPGSKNSRGVSRCSTVDHHDEPCDASNPTIENENHRELPFIKSSPIWATIESSQIYQSPIQNPHFSPLKKVKEDYREGLAIGHMVTFANVVGRTSRLQLTDPNDVIESILETLVDLESHGFDVGAVRARLNELLARKAELGRLVEESKEMKSELMKINLEKCVVEEEINELVGKMKELQEKLAQAVLTKNTKHEEMVAMQSKLRVIYDRITTGKLDFEKVAATPL